MPMQRVGACKLKLHLSRPSLQTQVASLKVQLANSRRISQGLAYKRIRQLPIHWLKQELRVSLLLQWMLHSMHQTCRAKGHETASMIKTPVRASCDHTSDAATSGRTGERRATQRAWAWACPASPQGAVAKAMPERHIGGLGSLHFSLPLSLRARTENQQEQCQPDVSPSPPEQDLSHKHARAATAAHGAVAASPCKRRHAQTGKKKSRRRRDFLTEWQQSDNTEYKRGGEEFDVIQQLVFRRRDLLQGLKPESHTTQAALTINYD